MIFSSLSNHLHSFGEKNSHVIVTNFKFKSFNGFTIEFTILVINGSN